MPLLPFIDFQVPAVNSPITLLDAQGSFVTAISYVWSGSESSIIDMAISRNGITEIKSMEVTSDGTNIGFDIEGTNNTSNSDSGITLTAVLNGSNIDIKYKSTSTGFNAELRYNKRNLSA